MEQGTVTDNNISKDITRKSKTNFLYSFSLLPKEKNDAINTVYAFCRKTDDIVDDTVLSIEEKRESLLHWKSDLEDAFRGAKKNQLFNELNLVKKKFNIPEEPFFDLIKGMEMDLDKNRYETFDELYEYCYCAAGTVGLMSIEIFGYNNEKTRDFAVKLGVALQLTNILRDIKKDAKEGRIYIPLEDLKRFNYSEEELMKGKYNDNYIKLMEFEAERAQEYYDEANSLLSKEDTGLMFPALIMQRIYHKLLKKIIENKYDVFSNEIKVSKSKKMMITFSTYLKHRFLYSMKDPRNIDVTDE